MMKHGLCDLRDFNMQNRVWRIRKRDAHNATVEPQKVEYTNPWLASSASKRWGEVFFLLYSPFWILILLGVVVPLKLYESFQEAEYLILGLLTVAPCFLVPLIVVCKEDAERPFYKRYWFKANVWIAIFGFVGNYFWTHYFYTVLGAIYTFPSYKINHVPITTFLLTQPYFLLYHAVSNMTLRRLEHAIKNISNRQTRWLIQAGWVLLLSYITALTEALTISHFPYYEMVDRPTFYKVGSLFYAIYFIVSFPMFKRLDEDPSAPWTLSQVAVDALGASMLVTIILDSWRITVGPIADIPWAASQNECVQFGPPWLRPSSNIKGVKASYNWSPSGVTQESYGHSRLLERASKHTEL
uniref:Cycloeucalenol cycloisomerase n=1 Tax=Physcomitrium patens TaxID=3218 RepID=A0A7I4APN8_PHYPA